MSMNDYFASIPHGPQDPPLLISTSGFGPIVYDPHDVDGGMYMLDRDFGGCAVLTFTKGMDPSVPGVITLDGQPLEGWILKTSSMVPGAWFLAVPLRGAVREAGKDYTLHIEGFTDVDGNAMAPTDLTVTCPVQPQPDPAYAQHEQVALDAAREGIVLLKNEKNALPLQPGALNLFGRAVHQFRNGAVGAGKINPRYSVNFLDAVGASPAFSVNEELLTLYAAGRDVLPSAETLARAKEASDTALFFLSRASGENNDNTSAKGDFDLTDDERALLACLRDRFAKVVVILNVGYPITLDWTDLADAIVYNGFGGMLGGQALLEVLSGAVNPSGKLPDTWAVRYEDIPAAKNFYDANGKPALEGNAEVLIDTVYEEDIYVGYRYFDTFGKKPAYPFGFGLSYTDFLLEPENIAFDGEALTLHLFVKNMGKVPGKEVPQVYVGKPDTDLEKPKKELAWFEKTPELAPGELAEFSVSVPKSHLTAYSEKDAAYLLEAGEYTVYVGNSSEARPCSSFTVGETEVVKQVVNRMQPDRDFIRLSKRDPQGTFPKGADSGVKDEHFVRWPMPYAKRGDYEAVFTGKPPAEKLSFAAVKGNPDLAADFVAQLSVEELARMNVCNSSGWGMEGTGEAGFVSQLDGSYDLPRFPVSDGNSGVNLTIKNIGMPSGATLCASWNKLLCEAVGRVIGEEAKTLHIPMILAPALNIHRNPLNGRQPEYFSEDPYLAGIMAGVYTRGLEGAGVAGSIKHMIMNNCESARKRNRSVCSERAIREIYFKAFEYLMEVHMPASVMTSYNAVNGSPTAADADLILGLLREENGFDGYVMTDWTTYDSTDVAAMVQAGNCWITPGSTDEEFTAPIVEGVRNGAIDLARLQDNVTRLVRVLARFA